MTTVANRRYLSPDRVFFDEVRRIGKFDQGAILKTLEFVIPRLQDPLPQMSGFGVVTVAGGNYLRYLWAQTRVLRRLSDCPVQCFHLGPQEIQHKAVNLLRDLGVEFVDAIPLMGRENYQTRHGWSAKSAALKYTRFRYACFMDADCIPLIDPETILNHSDFETGFLAWFDINKCRKSNMIFPSMGIKYDPAFREFEAGQQMWDRQRHWLPLQLFSFMNGRPKPFHDDLWGDKDIAPLSFMKLKVPFNVGGEPEWLGYGIRHQLTDGTKAFLHYMPDKRGGPMAPEVAELLKEFDSL